MVIYAFAEIAYITDISHIWVWYEIWHFPLTTFYHLVISWATLIINTIVSVSNVPLQFFFWTYNLIWLEKAMIVRSINVCKHTFVYYINNIHICVYINMYYIYTYTYLSAYIYTFIYCIYLYTAYMCEL